MLWRRSAPSAWSLAIASHGGLEPLDVLAHLHQEVALREAHGVGSVAHGRPVRRRHRIAKRRGRCRPSRRPAAGSALGRVRPTSRRRPAAAGRLGAGRRVTHRGWTRATRAGIGQLTEGSADPGRGRCWPGSASVGHATTSHADRLVNRDSGTAARLAGHGRDCQRGDRSTKTGMSRNPARQM